jgi:hypothetical protein
VTSLYARALRLRDLIERLDRVLDELELDSPMEPRDRSRVELTLESAAAFLHDLRLQEMSNDRA